MCRVSIIVPNYNHSPFLRRRMDSIFNQTYQDFEIILLDDCSTDDSRDILEQFRTCPKVSHIIYNQENSGSTFKQWSKGIELSKGEYIWIAESDDFCELTFLNELIPVLERNDNVTLGFCQSINVTNENKIEAHNYTTDYLSQIVNGKEFIKTKMLGMNAIGNASMAVFRKSKVELMPDNYKEMKYCGDWLFWINLCLQGDVFISGKYLNYFYRPERNVSSIATKKGLGFLEGNKIYHLIKNEIKISETDRRNALKSKIAWYLKTKNDFLDVNIHKEVLSQILILDPEVPSLMRKMIWKKRALNYLTKLKKYFP